jgi:hypothetical protein
MSRKQRDAFKLNKYKGGKKTKWQKHLKS